MNFKVGFQCCEWVGRLHMENMNGLYFRLLLSLAGCAWNGPFPRKVFLEEAPVNNKYNSVYIFSLTLKKNLYFRIRHEDVVEKIISLIMTRLSFWLLDRTAWCGPGPPASWRGRVNMASEQVRLLSTFAANFAFYATVYSDFFVESQIINTPQQPSVSN